MLDVFGEEPLPPDSPLYDTPNLLITPHTSWASDRVAERTVDLLRAPDRAASPHGEPQLLTCKSKEARPPRRFVAR